MQPGNHNAQGKVKFKTGRFSRLLRPAKSLFNRSPSPDPRSTVAGSTVEKSAECSYQPDIHVAGSSNSAVLGHSGATNEPVENPYENVVTQFQPDSMNRRAAGIAGTAFNLLKQALNITKELSDGFPPLKGALAGILIIMDYIETVDDIQTNFGKLASRIDALNSVLSQYTNKNVELPPSIRTRLDQFSTALSIQSNAINGLIQRGAFRRTLTVASDSQEIVSMIRTLATLIDILALDTALNTDVNVEKIRILDNLAKDVKNAKDEDVNIDNLLPVKKALCDPKGYPEEYKCCLPGTREDALFNALSDIQEAIESGTNHTFWLTGVAGSGKSTLSTSLVAALRDKGFTVASFFCKRDQADRRDPRRVIPTLSWYLASQFPEFRTNLNPVLNRKALPTHPSDQMDTFLLKPLQSLLGSPKIVLLIDALDESDDTSRPLLVDAFVQHAAVFPKGVCVILVSRKARDLKKKLESLPILLDLDRHLHDPSADHDIRLYLEDRLRDIREQQEEEPNWPSEFEVSRLTRRADGLFIWAVIACNFIEQPSCREELSRLLQTNAAVGIDDLYAHTLGSEFSKVRGKAAWFEDYRSVMGCIICSLSPLSPADIASLIGRTQNVINATLNILQPLLFRDEQGHVRLIHASLADYLLAEDRGQQLWVANPYLHLSLSRGCLNSLIKCSNQFSHSLDLTTLSSPSKFVHLLPSDLPSHIRYSAISWAQHLVQTQLDTSQAAELAEVVRKFLTTSYLTWLEILSLLGYVTNGVHSLNLLCSWVEIHGIPLRILAWDSYAFLDTFRVPIQRSVAHIYISALPFAPSGSQIGEIYRDLLDPDGNLLPVVRSGLPKKWPSDEVVQSVEFEESTSNQSRINEPGSAMHGFLVFSPDGVLVAHAVGQELRVWETQEGRLVWGPHLSSSRIESVEISLNNRLIACAAMSADQLIPHGIENIELVPEEFLEINVFPITDGFMPRDSLFLRKIKVVSSILQSGQFKIMSFSSDSSQLKILADLSYDDQMQTWNVETGALVENSSCYFPSLSSTARTDTIVFEHATGWLLNREGPSGALGFIPWYQWHVTTLDLYRNHCASGYYPASNTATVILGDCPIIIQFPKGWKNIQSARYERGDKKSGDQSDESDDDSVSCHPSFPSRAHFGLSEAETTARYQSVLSHMRYAEISEGFITEFKDIQAVYGSTVQFFCEIPFVHVRLSSLPPPTTLWIKQQDKGNSGEQLKFKFIPCRDPNEADGTRHFLVLGQRGFWPVYVVFDMNELDDHPLSDSEPEYYNYAYSSSYSSRGSFETSVESISSSPFSPNLEVVAQNEE
ncbi:hypothetical protein GYMLUDRAFT_49873 [Collybiopsis luxurians FD-317 M1]|uniref:Nephrocystin 3-like N-terminal domain-containing protein n=1 Tax=Collybiopsis luxurians FD-317 M1 TaxID=944289 RepID=A0A0D0BS88_9AGAR|nr:hypothetical protein GYMLUDRAFT_49873 [Collybiopsis luxurians FD-317 M1]